MPRVTQQDKEESDAEAGALLTLKLCCFHYISSKKRTETEREKERQDSRSQASWIAQEAWLGLGLRNSALSHSTEPCQPGMLASAPLLRVPLLLLQFPASFSLGSEHAR